MKSVSALNPELIKAYQSAEYHVMSAKPFILELGKRSEGLVDLAKRFKVECFTFITAYNPYSEVLSDKENAKRNGQLKQELDRLGLTIVIGYGQDPEMTRKKEDGFVVFGLGLDAAKELGVKFQQNAIVWCGADAVPNLVLLG
ncbi:Protein of unknown function DUF3293 [Methylophilaceae bacterium]